MLDIAHLHKSYEVGGSKSLVLRDLNLQVRRGEFVAILGKSGSGKSTLLQILGCLDRPDSGSYKINGLDVLSLTDAETSRLRATLFGFVFQAFCLLPHLSVLRNVALPMMYAGEPPANRDELASHWLNKMGLSHRIHHFPSQLSGGERQRVAIARAMVNSPQVLLADEPTGNLDPAIRDQVFDHLRSLQREKDVSLIVVTHDPELGATADRVLRLEQGKLCS